MTKRELKNELKRYEDTLKMIEWYQGIYETGRAPWIIPGAGDSLSNFKRDIKELIEAIEKELI